MHKCPKCGHVAETDEPLDDELAEGALDGDDLADAGDDEEGDGDLSDLQGDQKLRDDVLGEMDDLFGDDIAQKLGKKKEKGPTIAISIAAGKPKKAGGRF